MADALLCLVVSLTHARARRTAIADALTGLGIDFDFVDAVDAAAGFDPATDARVASPTTVPMSAGECACALSHALAWRRFLESAATHLMVLEDDALPTPALARFVAGGHYRACPMLLLFHSRARVRRGARVALVDGAVARPLALGCTGAVAYTVDRGVAERLLARNLPVRALADWPVDIARLGAHVVDPMLVRHPERVGDQSSLAEDRTRTRRRQDPWRWLGPDYARRRWRKLVSVRIS